MYNDKVLSIFNEPKNAGNLSCADGVGKVGNVHCGDIMKILSKLMIKMLLAMPNLKPMAVCLQ